MNHNSSATLDERGAQLRKGTILAAAGVLAFSFSLPGTALSLDGFGPWTSVGLRGSIAALLAGIALVLLRVKRPANTDRRGVLVVALGCALGFPLLTTLALETTSTAHSAVIVGALPMATASISSWLTGHRQTPAFWVAAGLGAVIVCGFSLAQNHGAPTVGDLLVVGAVLFCAAGYAEGGRLSAHMPGWQVIAWAVVLAAPVNLVVSMFGLLHESNHITTKGVVGLAYIALISQFLGFVVWYRGMGLIGVPRASQLQLAQPLLTVIWAVFLLGEHVTWAVPLTACAVIGCIVVTQRAGR